MRGNHQAPVKQWYIYPLEIYNLYKVDDLSLLYHAFSPKTNNLDSFGLLNRNMKTFNFLIMVLSQGLDIFAFKVSLASGL